jgi:putative SOS response-associated peptidase YedK
VYGEAVIQALPGTPVSSLARWFYLFAPKSSSTAIRAMRWGLVPSWAPDLSIGQRMIKSRSEILLKKPSFKQLVAMRRCLVPADGLRMAETGQAQGADVDSAKEP